MKVLVLINLLLCALKLINNCYDNGNYKSDSESCSSGNRTRDGSVMFSFAPMAQAALTSSQVSAILSLLHFVRCRCIDNRKRPGIAHGRYAFGSFDAFFDRLHERPHGRFEGCRCDGAPGRS